MDTVRSRNGRDIGPVIHHDRNLQRGKHPNKLFRRFHKFTGWRVVLHHAVGTHVTGSYALMRHSIACPEGIIAPVASSIFSPAAMRICALIKSTPVTSSVTGCST